MRTAHHSESASSRPTVDTAADALRERFGLLDCWFEPFPFDVQLPRIETGRIVLPATEPGVKPWRHTGGVELPVRLHGLTIGRFILVPVAPTCGVALSPEDRARAIDLADEIAPTIATDLFT